MNEPDARLVVALNRACPCTVRLAGERSVSVLNIAWGYEGDDHAHVTTNISPSERGAPVDFFFTCEVDGVTDGAGREVSDGLHPGGTCNHCF
jgi:hypothetical protein